MAHLWATDCQMSHLWAVSGILRDKTGTLECLYTLVDKNKEMLLDLDF